MNVSPIEARKAPTITRESDPTKTNPKPNIDRNSAENVRSVIQMLMEQQSTPEDSKVPGFRG